MPQSLVTTMEPLIIMLIDLYSCYVSLYLLFSTNLNLFKSQLLVFSIFMTFLHFSFSASQLRSSKIDFLGHWL